MKKTHEQYLQELKNCNKNVDLLEEYNGANTPILHKCKLCGYEWMLRPSDALHGKGCKFCGYKRMSLLTKRTHEEYINALLLINKNIEPIETYINVDTPIMHKCKICGHEWKIKPNHTLSGHGCKICAEKNNGGMKRKSIDQYINELNQINPNIKLIDKYINADTKILHQCKICGFNGLYLLRIH